MSPIDVDCPVCKAAPGKPCRRPSGERLNARGKKKRYHDQRSFAAGKDPQ